MTEAPHNPRFGRWTLHFENVTLETEVIPGSPESMYQVRLEGLTNSARVLDWIFQVREKTWASPSDVGDFVSALFYIYGRGFCGGGKDEPVEAIARLRRVGCKI